MNLNKNGWGLKEMLLLSAIIIFFFCLVIYFVYLLYNSVGLEVESEDNYVEELIDEYH